MGPIRPALSLVAVLLVQGCFLLEPPCGRVAGSICTIPGEESACASLRKIARDNEPAQSTCEKIEPIAAEYARDPSSLIAKTKWLASRAALAGAGLVGSLTPKETPGKKLEKAGRKLEEAIGKVGDAAQEAGEAVEGAVDGMKNLIAD